jgi:Major capsid protein N-terminus/Large eukaryotic DNA virus major capsid protein
MSTGATAGGAAHQLHMRGTLDFHLNMGSVRTYWRYQNTPHTNFATEPITQPFDNAPQWNGQTANASINRTGDLLHRMYCVIDLPPICAYSNNTGTSTNTQYAYINSAHATSALQSYSYYNSYDELFAGLQRGIEGYWCHWTDAIGYAMLQEVQLSVGSHIVDRFSCEFLYCWEELTGQSGKRCWDMVGRFNSIIDRILFARSGGRLHVPLPFWFTQVTGNALSLITLHYNIVKVHITFTNLAKLIIVSNQDVAVYKAATTHTGASIPVTTGVSSGTLLTASDCTAYLQSEMVYLDMPERTSFQQGEFDCLMTGVQTERRTIASGSNADIILPFNFPVSEIIVAGRMAGNTVGNRTFEFGRGIPTSPNALGGALTYGGANLSKPMYPIQTEGTSDYQGQDYGAVRGISAGSGNGMVDTLGQFSLWNRLIVGADPFVEMTLFINHSQRMAPQPANYFRQVQPFQHHSRIPANYIYVMSFSLFPEEANASGSLNFSKLDNATLRVRIHPDCVGYEMEVFCFAKYWNIFSYTRGVGGARYRA